jgi:misacylated tRNA(Ala) deacylase
MKPGEGRLDFELDAMSTEIGDWAQRRVNEEIQRAREILVDFASRVDAAQDPALIRTKADLIPRSVDPLRVIDIVGLDKQADGGTHVATTAEVGRVIVTKTESKGRHNKRIRISVTE